MLLIHQTTNTAVPLLLLPPPSLSLTTSTATGYRQVHYQGKPKMPASPASSTTTTPPYSPWLVPDSEETKSFSDTASISSTSSSVMPPALNPQDFYYGRQPNPSRLTTFRRRRFGKRLETVYHGVGIRRTMAGDFEIDKYFLLTDAGQYVAVYEKDYVGKPWPKSVV
jgi:hypothetical protein